MARFAVSVWLAVIAIALSAFVALTAVDILVVGRYERIAGWDQRVFLGGYLSGKIESVVLRDNLTGDILLGPRDAPGDGCDHEDIAYATRPQCKWGWVRLESDEWKLPIPEQENEEDANREE